MSNAPHIFLARHGQAGGHDYNSLTEAGRAQSTALGKHFASQGISFRACARGSLGRHKETLARIAEQVECGTQNEISELDEITPQVWFGLAEALRNKDDAFRDSFKDWIGSLRKEAPIAPDKYKAMMAAMLGLWVSGNHDEGIESFQEFHNRVLRAKERVEELHARSDGPVLVVSSGTPIALWLGDVVGFSIERSLAWLNWIRNTSLSVFTIAHEKWEPVSLNATPHLSADQASLI